MNCSDEEDIFYECAATSETNPARNLDLTPPSSSFTNFKIDLAHDGSPRKQSTTLSTSYSNLSTRYNFTFFDGTTPRIARPRDSPPRSISANHMTGLLSQTKPLSTPPTTNTPQTKIPNSQCPATPDQIGDPSYESKFGLITPPPTLPATSELLASPKSTTESGPNLAPLTPPQTPPHHKYAPPTRELSNCFFSCVKTKSKPTPQPSQLKPITPTPKHRGFQVVQYSPSPTIFYEVEAGTKYGLGERCRELSVLEMSREKRKIMIRKLSYGMKAELKDIMRRMSLADKRMQVQKEVERGYGLGIWKGKDGDADEDKVVDSTLERMNLWFAQSRIC